MKRTKVQHCDDLLLDAYANGPQSVEDPAVAAHVASCQECAAGVEFYRMLAEEVLDDSAWWSMERAPGFIEGLSDFEARLAREDAEAEVMLRPLLKTPYAFTGANVTWSKRFHTGGVVRLLSETARQQMMMNAKFAIVLAEAAQSIARKLPDDFYPNGHVHELRGNAWKDYASACRYSGRLDEGLEALDSAAQAFQRMPAADINLGTVALARAGLLLEQERYADGLSHVRAASLRFKQYAVGERFLQAKEVEAALLHAMGDVDSARATYEQAFAFADELGDPDMKARAARNLGVACRDAGDFEAAANHFLLALQLYDALGFTTMVAATRWSIAVISLMSGDAKKAAELLPPIVSELDGLGLAWDAGRAQLDLAEALVILNQFAAAETVCSKLVDFFTRAKLLTGAMRAAAYLKEAAAARRLSREDIASVRVYLTELERAPDLVFAPPPPHG